MDVIIPRLEFSPIHYGNSLPMRNLPVSQSEKTNAIRQTSYFSNMDESVVDQLSRGTALRRYERGEVLFWEGDPCAGR